MKNNFYLILLFAANFVFAQSDCNNAVPVALGMNSSPQITGELPTLDCGYNNTNASVANWFRFSINEETNIIVTTDLETNQSGDTRIRVYSGSCSEFECVAWHDDLGANNNQYGPYLSRVSFDAEPGVDYYLVFDDRWEDDAFDFLITTEEIPDVPISFTSSNIGGGNSRSCAVDMNGDYLDDIVDVTNSGFTVYYQQLDGTFDIENVNLSGSYYSNSWSIAAADLNGDLKNDLFFGAGSGASLILSNPDNNQFSIENSPFYVFSQRNNFVDIDNDGNLDAFVCHDVEPNVYVMNDGEGNYNWIQGGLGDFPSGGNYGSIWVDYDNDGDQDLFIAKCRGGSDAKINELHRNNGDGTFTNVSSEANMEDRVQTWSSAWGDYDNDGDFDAYVGASYFADGHHRMMINNGDGTFTDIVHQTMFEQYDGTGIENTAFDFDNDGNIDILADAGNGSIFLNRGNWEFERVNISISAGAVADLNNDGFLDIYRNGTILYNDGNDNHWIKIVTVGDVSNTNGIGARITLTTNAGTQIREVRSGQGFSHAHSLNTHFGLGEEERIDEIVVQWPSGIVDTYTDVDIDATLFVMEGETLSTVDVAATTQELSIYPNPAKSEIRISSETQLKDVAYVYDSSGKMMQFKIENNHMNIQKLQNGVYFLKAVDVDGNVHRAKFIVKH